MITSTDELRWRALTAKQTDHRQGEASSET